MLRIYRYNSPYEFQDFETHLFTTLRPTFDHANDRLYISGVDYRISTINYIGLFNKLIDNQASYTITFGREDQSWAVVSNNQNFTLVLNPKLSGCLLNIKLTKATAANLVITLPNNSYGKDIAGNAITLTGAINTIYILSAIYENGEYDWLVRSRTDGYGVTSLSWTAITDKPTEFPPTAHNHPEKANIAGDTFTGNVTINKNSDVGAYFGIINQNANGNVLLEMIGDPAIPGLDRNRIILYRAGSTDANAESRFRGNGRIACDTKMYIGGNTGILFQVDGTLNQDDPMIDVIEITQTGLLKTLLSGYSAIVDDNSFVTKAYNDARYSLLSHNHAGIYEPAFTKNTAFNKNFETDTGNLHAPGIASLGVLSTMARADHVHPSEFSLKMTYISIGSWNMNANQSKTVDWDNSGKVVIGFDAIIYNDDATGIYKINHYSTQVNGAIYYNNGTTFTLSRIAFGYFDSTSFDGTSNRGYICIHFIYT